MKAAHKALSTARYDEHSEQISRDFDLMRHSLNELGQAGFRRFIEIERKPKISAFQKALDGLRKTSFDPDLIEMLEEGVREFDEIYAQKY